MDSIEEVNRRFNEQVRKVEQGSSVGIISLGNPSEILLASQIDNTELFIRESVLRQHMRKHGLTSTDLQNLPRAIQTPLMVYEWGEKAKSQVVVTGIEHGTQRITVAIKLERGGRHVEVNEVASVHGKDIERLLTDMNTTKTSFEKDNLKYIDKKRVVAWLNLTPPMGADVRTKQQLYATKIVQNFQNPPLKNQKTMEKVEQERQEFRSYYPDGSLYTVEERKNGQRDGLYREYYINGRLSREWHYKEGKPDGLIREWRPDGTPHYETNFRNGKRDGLSRRYFDNGQIFQENNFKDGELDGLTRVWHPDGRFNYELNYHNGVQISQPVTVGCRRAEQKQTTKQSQPKKKRGLGM